MKNLYVFAILLCAIVPSSGAQSYKGKSDHKINVGYELYGIGNGIKASYDLGLNELFSIGVGGSIYINNEKEDYFFYARTNFHFGDLFDLPRKLDIYPGIELGYLSSKNVGISGYVGLRYFLTKKIGIFTELGNNGTIGLSLNL